MRLSNFTENHKKKGHEWPNFLGGSYIFSEKKDQVHEKIEKISIYTIPYDIKKKHLKGKGE